VPAMKGWRYEMFGRQAELLKRGELALKVEGGEVVAVRLAAAARPADAAADRDGAGQRKRSAS